MMSKDATPVAESMEVQRVEDKARELLAHEYSMRGQPSVALLIRSAKSLNPDGPYAAAVAAIAASYEVGRAEGVRAAAEVADTHARKTDTPDDFTLGYEEGARRIASHLRALSKEPTK